MNCGRTPADATRRLRWALLALCALIAIHGSLYPWLFKAPPSWELAVQSMFVDRLWWTGRDDALINILLFAPIGAFGGLVLDGWARSSWTRVLSGVSAAFVFAFVLQALQLWIPEREAALSDALWNALGAACGMPLAALLRPLVDRLAQLQLARHHAALVMGTLWVAAMGWPLMPSHSLRQVAKAMQPLWGTPLWNVTTVADTALSLAAVLMIARTMHRRWWFAGSLVACALIGRLLGRDLHLTHSLLVGLLIGAALGRLVWRMDPRVGASALGAATLAWYACRALYPFDWGASPAKFHWLPLWAPLQAARVAHTLVLVWALFWTGIWTVLAQGAQWSAARTGVALTAMMLAIEWAQRWLLAQQADITPVLFPALWWWFWRRWPPAKL